MEEKLFLNALLIFESEGYRKSNSEFEKYNIQSVPQPNWLIRHITEGDSLTGPDIVQFIFFSILFLIASWESLVFRIIVIVIIIATFLKIFFQGFEIGRKEQRKWHELRNIAFEQLRDYELMIRELCIEEVECFMQNHLYNRKVSGHGYNESLKKFALMIKKLSNFNLKLKTTTIPLLEYENYLEKMLEKQDVSLTEYRKILDSFRSIVTKPQKLPTPPETRYKNARKIDNWDEINMKRRLTGAKGEEIVIAFEQEYLTSLNRKDLSDKVQWVSKDIGDGLGYDIQSFFEDGRAKYIEVKSSARSLDAPFYLSRNEHNFLNDHFTDYRLYRVTNANDVPVLKVYTSTEVLDQHEMIPEQYMVKKKNR